MVPDYYAMLGVSPRADRSTIEAALARNQPVWSAGTRNPKTKHTFQSYLDQIPAIRQALLGDPSSRADYDAELVAALKAERDAKLDILQKRIRLRAAKGGLTVADRTLLRAEAERFGLTSEDLDRLVEPIPPKPEAPASLEDAPEPTPDILEPVMRRQTRVALDHLRKRDLYDALGLPRDTPIYEVAARAEAERRRWMKKTQVTAEKTAWLEVITLAQSHLTNPHARARYNRTLVFEAEEALAEAATFALGGQPRLDPGTREVLRDEAEALGVEPDRAERIVGRVCRKLGVTRDGVAFTPTAAGPVAGNRPPRLLRCRSCSGVTDFDKVAHGTGPSSCRHCGASLHWACPVCQRMMWVDEPRCTCGFRIELREPLVYHFEAAQKAFKIRDYPLAFTHLERVREFAPRHVGARKGLEMVKQKTAEIERAQAAFEVAKAGGRLVEAAKALGAWAKLVAPGSLEWKTARNALKESLREAESFIARARLRERSDPRGARELYRRALALAVDLPEARESLERSPPDPAAHLTAEYSAGGVLLRWSPPPPDDLGPQTFVVLRKPEAAFSHPQDGVRIGETSRPEFVDADVTPGTSMSYAVLTKRGTVESVNAVTVGPMFLMGEVRDVHVEARQREVDLSWTPPPNVAEVRVARKRGSPPRDPLDGEYVEASLDHALDRGLEPDRVYQYGLFAVFKTPDGRSTASRGTFVTALPHTPLRPLDAPVLTTEHDGRVKLRWVEPSRGIVKLLRTKQPFPYPAGTRLAPIQVASLEGDWVELSAPDMALDTPPSFGAFHYTPLTSWGGTITVGHSASYSCVTDPSDLRAARIGTAGRVHLRWRWSPHGSQSLIVARQGAPPVGIDDPEAIVETVHEVDYSRVGYHAMTLLPSDRGPWHITVYALSSVDDQLVVSPGLDLSSRTTILGLNQEVTLAYSFDRKRLAGRRWFVTFRTEPPSSPIPATVLVSHPRTVPLSADDGTIVGEFPASRDGASFPLPDGVNLGKVRVRIFPDPRVALDSQSPIRLRHPEAGGTRV
jgi:hypothetical protein